MKTQDVFPDGLKLFFLVFLKDPIPRRFLALVLIRTKYVKLALP